MKKLNLLVLDYIKRNRHLIGKNVLFTIITFLSDFILAPKFLSSLINKLNKNEMKDINVTFFLLILMYVLRIIFGHLLKMNENEIYPQLIQEIRTILYGSVVEKHAENYKDLKIGNIYSRIQDITADLRMTLQIFNNRVFPLFFVNVIIAIIFINTDNHLGIILIASLTLFLIIVNYYYPKIVDLRKKNLEIFYKNTDNMNNKFSNLMNIYINNESKKEKGKINKDQVLYKYSFKKSQNKMIILGSSLSILGTVTVFLVISQFVMKNKSFDSNDRIYLLFLITFYLRNCFKLSRDIPKNIHFVSTIHASEKFLKELLYSKSKTYDYNLKTGNIEFKNVNFKYSHGPPIIKNLNLKINTGEKIGLIGRSGSGKSTLMKLLIRLYPYEGEIRIDNKDISKIKIESLRKQILYINQKTNLDEDTVLENIKYGNKVSDEEIYSFIKKYDLEIIFSKLKNKLDTNVGMNGNNLSLGMQKMTILLRGIFKIKDSKVIIFDEPLAGLDENTRKKVMNILKDLDRTKTIIIISHNSEILPFVDRTIDINEISK